MSDAPRGKVLVAGGGIGGMAAALALSKRGLEVEVFEQSAEIGEIGAGVQLAPNAFAAFDALGVGERARGRAVYTNRMVMMDAVDGSVVAEVPFDEPFRARFGNPYAVMHRADVHGCLVEGARAEARIAIRTSTRIERFTQGEHGVVAVDSNGGEHRGTALIGCDGVKSAVRGQLVGDPVRVSGHVVYRAVVDAAEFPADLAWNAAAVWAGPNCHLVHYPLRGGEQYNVVVTFHSRETETWGVREGSREEVLSYFGGICAQARQLLELPRSWKRWATADREPIARWSEGAVTLLGDAAHPLLQYLAQGACMAMEDAVTLGAALDATPTKDDAVDWPAVFLRYQDARVARTARVVLMTREMGRLYHAKDVERLVRNQLWKGRTPERYYDALEWLYGWTAERCLEG